MNISGNHRHAGEWKNARHRYRDNEDEPKYSEDSIDQRGVDDNADSSEYQDRRRTALPYLQPCAEGDRSISEERGLAPSSPSEWEGEDVRHQASTPTANFEKQQNDCAGGGGQTHFRRTTGYHPSVQEDMAREMKTRVPNAETRSGGSLRGNEAGDTPPPSK